MNNKKLLLAATVFIITSSAFAQTDGCISGNCTNGIGTYLWETKQEYTGEFVNGIRTGLGVYDWDDGSYYYGFFVNGILEGKGIYLSSDEAQTTLVGTFHDGKLADANNFIATGCLLGNCTDGVGVYLWDNNDMYIGKWVHGERTGYGRFDWADGSLYTGEFKNGQLDGKGYYKKADGKIMDGDFVNGSFTGTVQDPLDDGEISKVPKPEPKPTIFGDYENVCLLLQNVIKGFPDNFKAIQGNVNVEESDMLTAWTSTVKLKGTQQALLHSGLSNESVPFMWSNKVYTSDNYNAAKDKYNALITEFKNCSCSCCTFSISEATNTRDNDIYTTNFDVLKLNTGFSSDYDNLEIDIELKEDAAAKKWNIHLQVINTENY